MTLTTLRLSTSDTTAPGSPALTATPMSANEVDLSWSLPSDSDLTGFLVYQGSQLLEDIPPNSSIQTRVLPVTGLSAQASYTFSVQSYDAAGNLSVAGTKTVTTLATSDVRVVRGPYVQRVDARSARIVWRTNVPAPSNLTYSDGVTSYPVLDAALQTDHSVLIGPLPSLARITYTLNYPTPKSGSFTTCSTSPATMAIDAVGDMGAANTPEKSIATLIANDHPNLIAAVGDNVYPTGADKDYPSRLLTPYAAALAGSAFVTAYGNHEYYSPGGRDSHGTWSQPGNGTYFSFDCSGVHVAVVDNYQPYAPGTAQYQWLQNDLATTTQPWKIVMMHVPAYSSSVAGTAPGSTGALDPLFEKYGVQVVIAGHSHNYERTSVINGVTYIVDGGGGNGLNTFSGTAPSWSAYRAAEYSYLRLSISSSQIQGTEVRQDGTTGDTFTIPASGPVLPDTVIDPGSPSPITKASSATFTFHATQTPATFRCTLDQTTSSCSSPMTYTGLGEGAHTFTVVATTGTGPDPTPATYSWTVDTTPPTSPVLTTATAQTATTVALTWTPSSDSNGIRSYDILRDGSTIATTTGTATGYTDTTVGAGSTHQYQVAARDPADNVSPPSNAMTVTTPPSTGPALIQAAGSSTSTITFGAVSTAGDLLVLSASVSTGLSNQITAVTDSAGNTWTKIGAYATSGHNSDGELWYAANAQPVRTVTVQLVTTTSLALQVEEFSGIATTGTLDASVGASNTGTAANSNSITPAGTHDLVVGFVAGHGNTEQINLTSPSTALGPQQTTSGTGTTSVTTGFLTLSTSSPQTAAASFAGSMYWAAGVAAFRAAG